MSSRLPEDDFSLEERQRNVEYIERKCQECGIHSKNVYDRKSFAQIRLLCRECVSIVEEERHQRMTDEVFHTIREDVNDD